MTNFLYSIKPEKLRNELNVNSSREITNKLKNTGYNSVLLEYFDDTRSWLDKFIEINVFNPNDITIIHRYEHGDDSPGVRFKKGYK